jgi:hypothetical protein
MIRRLAAVASAAALAASTLLAVLPAAAHPLDSWYMKGDGVPVASLSKVVPLQLTLPDYDQDGKPGRTLKRTSKGEAETDKAKYQEWVLRNPGLEMDGAGSISFWSAMKDFDTERGGSVTAYLLDCKDVGETCTMVTKGTLALANWSGDNDGWVEHELVFDAAFHVFASDAVLAVRIVVNNASQDDMWFAYDTLAQPTHVHLPVELVPTTITLPTVTVTVTLPTIISTTSTTRPTTTTSTTRPTTTTSSTSSTTTTEAGGVLPPVVPPPSTTSTTTPGGPPPGDPSAVEEPVDMDRQGLVVSGQITRHAPDAASGAKLELSPLQGVAVGFRTVAETIHSQLLASVLLGIVTATLAVAGSGRRKPPDSATG